MKASLKTLICKLLFEKWGKRKENIPTKTLQCFECYYVNLCLFVSQSKI